MLVCMIFRRISIAFDIFQKISKNFLPLLYSLLLSNLFLGYTHIDKQEKISYLSAGSQTDFVGDPENTGALSYYESKKKKKKNSAKHLV